MGVDDYGDDDGDDEDEKDGQFMPTRQSKPFGGMQNDKLYLPVGQLGLSSRLRPSVRLLWAPDEPSAQVAAVVLS